MPGRSPRAQPGRLIENVCARVSDAAFLDEFTCQRPVGERPACGVPAASDVPRSGRRDPARRGIHSREPRPSPTRSAAGIDISFDQGELARLLRSSGYFSPRNMDYFSAMMDAQRRERWLLVAIACSLRSCFHGFTAFRMRSQRNRIRATTTRCEPASRNSALLANNLSEMVLAFDMEGRLVFANPAVERVTGYSVAGSAEPGFRWPVASRRPRP